MTTAMHEAYGPVDFVLLEFPSPEPPPEAAEALLELVAKGVVTLYDLLILRKDDDGTVDAVEVTDPDAARGFARLLGLRSGLLSEEDVAAAAEEMEPGTTAVLIVYENTWAAGFVAAARAGGGELVASARIPATDLMDALERLESSE